MDTIFPPDEERELVITVCTSCHSFLRIVYGHHSHSHGTNVPGEDTHWDPHRVRHETRFRALSKEQIDTIYAYLKANFNDTKPAPKLPSWLKDAW